MLRRLLAQYRSLTTVKPACVAHVPSEKVEMSVDPAQVLLRTIKDGEEGSKNKDEFFDMIGGGEGSKSDCSINREVFLRE